METRLFRLLLVAAAGVGLASLGLVLWRVALPYPLHSREFADTLSTSLLLHGRNPYGLEVQPVYFYVYGFMQAFVAYPFALVFGPTLQLHRAISLAALILSCLTLFWALRRSGVSRALAAVGASILFDLTVLILGAKPDCLGQLFFLLSVVVPFTGNFRWGSLVASVVFTLLAFYTKAYYVIGAPFLAGYLFLFQSKKAGVGTGLLFIFSMAGSIALVNALFPYFFSHTFYANLALVASSYRHLAVMILLFSGSAIGLEAVLAWALVQEGGNFFRAWPRWNWREPDRPLVISPQLSWPMFLLLFCTLCYVVRLGTHIGAGLSYVYELVAPFVIWQAFAVLGKNSSRRPMLLGFIIITFAVLGGTVGWNIYHQARVTGLQRASWQHAAQLVAAHPDVLAEGPLALLITQQGRELYDNGQSEYWRSSLFHNRSPRIEAYRERGEAQRAGIVEKIQRRQFDGLLLFSEGSPLLPPDFPLATYYHHVDTFFLWMPENSLDFDLWEPNR